MVCVVCSCCATSAYREVCRAKRGIGSGETLCHDIHPARPITIVSLATNTYCMMDGHSSCAPRTVGSRVQYSGACEQSHWWTARQHVLWRYQHRHRGRLLSATEIIIIFKNLNIQYSNGWLGKTNIAVRSSVVSCRLKYFMKRIYISRPVPSLACNGNCSCDPTAFTPVCGSDGRNYFSTCYAGCQNESIVAGKTVIYLYFLLTVMTIVVVDEYILETSVGARVDLGLYRQSARRWFSNKCVSKRHIRHTRRVQLNLCAEPRPPFQRQHFRRSLHASICSTQGIESDISARLLNIISASCDLELSNTRGRRCRYCVRDFMTLSAFCLR